jgi:uncharacterized protein (TIGR02996 family)
MMQSHDREVAWMNDERPFLRQIINDPADEHHRLVYADWLEERGECDRAEFLRLECDLARLEPTTPDYLRSNERFHELYARIDRKWLALLDRTDIDNCRLRFGFRCPLRWERLQPTAEREVRFCTSCQKEVHHCHTIGSARVHAAMGHCVAVDSRLTREPGDLDPETETTTMLMGVIEPSYRQQRDSESTAEYESSLGGLPILVEPAKALAPTRKRWWQFWK